MKKITSSDTTQDGGSSTQFQSPIDDRFSGNAFQRTILARGVAQVKELIDYRLSIGDEYTLVLLPCDSIEFPLTTATKHPHRFWLFTFLYAILFKQVLVSTLSCVLSICIGVRLCVYFIKCRRKYLHATRFQGDHCDVYVPSHKA